MAFKNIFIACLALVAPAVAHMQMDYPLPINSQHDPLTPDNLKDYSYTSPLNADGSNFPCKGYHTQTPIRTTATFEAGATNNITIVGSATHLGGSCQLSLSYDNGKTFRVIKSMIGACPLTPNYDFTIPSYAPAGTALFAWTWFNEVGNREMYMNCAWINVDAPAATKQKRQQLGNSAKFRRAAALTSLDDHPTIWVANIPTQNTCTTTSGADPVFPNPGPDVQYGGSMSSSSPASPGNCDGVSSNAEANSGSQTTTIAIAPSSPAASPVASSPPTHSFDAIASSSSSICSTTTTVYSTYTYTVSGSSTFAPMTTSPSASTTTFVIATATAPSTTITFSVVPTSTASSQPAPTSAAPATAGTFSTENQGACGSSAMGSLMCTNGGQGFSMCNWGQWIPMGAVAAGTQCTGSDGQATIVAANSSSASPSSGSGSTTPATSPSTNDSTVSTQTTAAADGNCNGAQMGSIKCTNGGQQWSMCNWSSWVNMGSVAAGTQCQGADGQAAIVAV